MSFPDPFTVQESRFPSISGGTIKQTKPKSATISSVATAALQPQSPITERPSLSACGRGIAMGAVDFNKKRADLSGVFKVYITTQ